MTTIEAISEQAIQIVTDLQVGWTVAVAPLPGQLGPCWAFPGWSLTPQIRSSGGLVGQLLVETEITGLDETEADTQAPQAMRRLAQVTWTSDSFRVLDGHLRSVRCLREEGPRQKTWVVEGTIEYLVELIMMSQSVEAQPCQDEAAKTAP